MDDSNPTPEEQPVPEANQHAPLPFAHPVSDDEASAPGAAMHGEARLANFGLRLGAYLLDWLIVFVPVLLILAASMRGKGGGIVGSFVPLAAGVVYAWLLIAKRNGQTLGMQALKIRCVREIDGEPVDSSQAGQRAAYAGIFGLVSAFLIFPALVDYLWPLWDKKNQTLHDKLAKTVVIDLRHNPGVITF